MDDDSDKAITARAKGGERDALVELIRRHDADLRSLIRSRLPQHWQHLVSADDVVQQTYTDILARPDLLPTTAAFPAWLVQVAIRNLIDLIRLLEADKRGGTHRAEGGECCDSVTFFETLLHSPTRSSPSRHVMRDEANQMLSVALERLPVPQRVAVQRYDLEGRSVEEVAAELGRSPGAVHVLRCRAHDRLRELLSGRSSLFRDSV